MLSLIRTPTADYRDQLLRKQVFETVSETELAKLAVATAVLAQIELVEIHLPKILVAARVVIKKYTSRKDPTCE